MNLYLNFVLPLFSSHIKIHVAFLFLPFVLWKHVSEARWSTRIMSGCSKHQLLQKRRGTEGDNVAARSGSSPARGPVPQPSSEASRAGPGVVASFNQQSRSSDNFVVTRQVRPQARKSIHRSGSGLVRLTRVRHSRVITRQVHSDEVGLRSS